MEEARLISLAAEFRSTTPSPPDRAFSGDSARMLHSVASSVSAASQCFVLRPGDAVFCGSPRDLALVGGEVETAVLEVGVRAGWLALCTSQEGTGSRPPRMRTRPSRTQGEGGVAVLGLVAMHGLAQLGW